MTTDFVFYHYSPSLVAAVIFVALFGVASFVHVWQMLRKRAWFLVPFIIGGLFETVGYIGRILSHYNQYDEMPYIMQSLLILMAPALFAATIYMILGRIILLTDGERYSLIRRTLLTKLFVTGDVITFFMQGMGGGLQAMGKKGGSDDQKKFAKTAPTLGKWIIIVALILQIIFFGFFVVTAIVFQIRGRVHFATLEPSIRWRKHLYTLYATSIMILIRCLFRIIEYTQGNDGYLISHEIFLYIFDAVLMFSVMIIMSVSHPGDIATILKKKGDNIKGDYALVSPKAGRESPDSRMWV